MAETEIANSEGCLEAISRHDGIPQPRRVAIHSDGQDLPTPPVLPQRSPLRPGFVEGRRVSRLKTRLEGSRLSASGSSHLLSHLLAMMPVATLTPAPEPVPVLRTPSFSSLSQLLEVLGSTPDLQSVLGVVDEFEDEFDRERESDQFNDTLAAALASSYTRAIDSSIDTDSTNPGHTPTVEFARDKELPLPPSTLPLSLPIHKTPAMSHNEGSQPPALTKRRHALLELLTSERAYASDLALIRDVYMRLASGKSHSLLPF